MADLMAIIVVSVQFWMIVLVIDSCFGAVLPASIAVAIFVVLVSVGLVVWHKRESAQTVERWQRLIFGSIILGVLFFACDLLLSFLHGQSNPLKYPGGLLGLPLTVTICPGFTMICIAGLVRTLYLNLKTNVGHG